jgi:hypothetical protein
LQGAAAVTLLAGLVAGVTDVIWPAELRLHTSILDFEPASPGKRVRGFLNPLLSTSERLLRPAAVFVLCEIALTLDRRLSRHPEDEA